jgi:lysozyme
VLNIANKTNKIMAKKVRGLGKSIFYFVVCLAILAKVAYYVKERFFKPGFVHYSAFGIDIPTNYAMHGIDVSRYQEDINWGLVKKMKVNNIAIDFVFIKATEGMSLVDEEYKNNISGAREVGIPLGAYHFFIANRSGKLQAANFIETVRLKKGDLPPVLDVEKANGASIFDMQQRVADWLNIVEKKYKVKPIIYTNADFYKTFLADRFDDYPLWVAHYLVKDKPRIDRRWIFWQHSESAQVTGIRTNVDFNAFNGSKADFEKLLIKE